jgi:hypothetical protein
MVSVKKESVLDALSDEGARIVGEEMLRHNRLLRRLTVSDDIERVARAICERGVCFRAEVFGEPCIDPKTQRDAPCRATSDQLILSWRWNAAEAAIRAMQPAPLPVVRFKDGERDV